MDKGLIKVPIAKAAEDYCKNRTKLVFRIADPKDFYKKQPIYGAIEIKRYNDDYEKIVGYIAIASKRPQSGNLSISIASLPSEVEYYCRLKKIVKDIIASKAVYSKDALPLVFFVSKHIKRDGYSWTVPFVTYQTDVRWVSDLIKRDCFHRQYFPETFFFAD